MENNQEEKVIRPDVGIFMSNKKGFGFVKPEDGSGDIFIPAKSLNGAFHNDTVRFKIVKEDVDRGSKEGVITEVLEHKITSVVGTYNDCTKFGFVKPDIKNIAVDIFVPGNKSKHAQNNDKVLVEILNYGSKDKRPDGVVVEVLGNKDKPGIDILSILKSKDIPTEFEDDVIKYSKKIPNAVESFEYEGREDFRNVPVYTIDGEETRDYDDALSIIRDENGFHVGVHIADVTHYVKEGDPIDLEAKFRGTSVYPVDRVIPMLPEKLSTGICSLVEGEDRLTLSCIIDFDNNGKIVNKKIAETVINVTKRLSYNQVADALDNPENVTGFMKDIYPDMVNLKELSDILKEIRKENGAVEFEFPEADVKLDEEGHPIDIVPRLRNSATAIIEELMLIANETVAEYVTLDKDWAGTPLIYRSHEDPDGEKLENLKRVVLALGYKFPIDLNHITSTDVQKLIDSVKGTDDEFYISMMTLRCMKRAYYSTSIRVIENGEPTDRYEPIGHFGLAAEFYCHFTSPIRRYADLANHRIIKKKLHGNLTKENIASLRKNLPDIAQHISEMEYRSIEAEREAVRLKMSEYMKRHIGDEFDGIIAGLAQWGIYVELPNTIEGLIPCSSLEDGYYTYDETNLILMRETGGREFRIGQKLRVKVEDADPEFKTITFGLVKEYN